MAEMPSPRPSYPIPSVVVAFTFTCAAATRKRAGKVLRHESAVRRQPRRLADHHHVHIADGVARRAHPGDDLFQQPQAVRAFVGRIVVREELADVAQPGGAEHGVGHRVGHHVGV